MKTAQDHPRPGWTEILNGRPSQGIKIDDLILSDLGRNRTDDGSRPKIRPESVEDRVAAGLAIRGSMARLIIVDDEPAFCDMVGGYLSKVGHTVRKTGDGAGLRRLLAEGGADLVLLDLGLPGEDGFTLARWLKEHQNVGIIVLTGADSVIDRVVGLEIGADDYVTKPLSLSEVAARIEAVMRRRRVLGNVASFGAFTVDLKGWRVIDPQGLVMDMSSTEVDLVAAFATNPGKVLTRDDILRLAPAQNDESFDRSIDTRISRLRRKLERRGVDGDLIKTFRGAGYVYHPPGSDPAD